MTMAKTAKKKKTAKGFFKRNDRAICDAMIATVHHGRRIVQKYRSGQPLVGRLAERADGMF